MDVRLATFLAAVMLCGSFEASAAVNALSAMGPVGGSVNKLLFSAIPNAAFLINNGGLYRSQDGGASWALVEANIFSPMDMALDPADSKRLYVVSPAPASLLVSTDGGVSLSTVASLPSAVAAETKVVVSQNGDTICLANGPRLYCSLDSGQTWQGRTPVSTYVNAVINNLIMDPEDSNSLYVTAQVSAAANAANFATHDGGITWQQLTPTGISVVGVYALAINPTNSRQLWSAQTDGIWMSADRGQTWTNVFSSPVVSIAIDPSNPAVVYVGDDQGHVFRSGNSGTAWTDVTGNLAVGQVGSIAINASQDSRLLVGGTNGVAGSSTAGGVWASQNTGFNGTSITELSADPTTDRIYIASPSSGIFYTANGSGMTVAANNSALAQLQTQSTLLGVGPVLAQPGSVMAAIDERVARSTDGGNTWSSSTVAQGGDALTALVSAAAAPQIVLAASPTGLYRSGDGGSSWNPITAGLPAGTGVGKGSGPSVGSLYAAQSNPNVFYYACPVQPPVGSFPSTLILYRSTDAGLTWSTKNFDTATGPDAIVAVDPTNADVLYAAAANSAGMAASIHLLKSADGGATWTPLNWDISAWTQMPLAIAVDPVHPQILYASTIGPLGRSVDGGASWQLFRTVADHPWWNSWSLLVDPKRPETLLVSTAMSGVQEITFEPDLALTVSPPASAVAVGMASSYTYTVANNGPFDATDVTVLVHLPATAQKISATASGGTCSVAAAVASCTFAVLRAAASSSLTVNATAPAAGSFAVTASVKGDQPDPDATNNTVSSTGTVETMADVAVKATGTATSQVGASVTYTLTASNSGPDPAPGTQLTFQLPAGVVFGAVSSTSGTCSGAASLVTCGFGDLATASPATITVDATTSAAGMQTATASITTSATDPVSTNNTATVNTTVTSVSTTVTSPPSGKGGGGSLSLWVILTLAVYRAVLLMREAGSFGGLRQR